MSRKSKVVTDDNQPSLFPEARPVKHELVIATSRIASILDEDARIRRSFTSKEEYYKSPQWQYKRLQKIRQAGYKCELCGRSGSLDVHHLDYGTLYDEDMSDLQAVCRRCHPFADDDREYSSAFTSYLRTKFGDDVGVDYSDYAEEFDKWYSSKNGSDW